MGAFWRHASERRGAARLSAAKKLRRHVDSAGGFGGEEGEMRRKGQENGKRKAAQSRPDRPRRFGKLLMLPQTEA